MSDNKAEMYRLQNIIESAIQDAEEFADEHKLAFKIKPAYGMGGYYDGADQQWYPSSESCY